MCAFVYSCWKLKNLYLVTFNISIWLYCFIWYCIWYLITAPSQLLPSPPHLLNPGLELKEKLRIFWMVKRSKHDNHQHSGCWLFYHPRSLSEDVLLAHRWVRNRPLCPGQVLGGLEHFPDVAGLWVWSLVRAHIRSNQWMQKQVEEQIDVSVSLQK